MMPVIGGTEGAQVSAGMQSAVKIVESVGDNVFPFFRYSGWYGDMEKEVNAQMGNMLTKKITPEEFVAAAEKIAAQVKADPDVTKFERKS
jgi:hypothetical protein